VFGNLRFERFDFMIFGFKALRCEQRVPWFTAYKRTNRLDVVESVESGEDGRSFEDNIVKN
jgi:hypothetical protein